ncbi:type II toxin-antitoxin system RelE/ParE family toxin, partial [Yersinia pestis]
MITYKSEETMVKVDWSRKAVKQLLSIDA